MAGSNFIDNGLLSLIYNGGTITGIASNAASGAITNIYVALHTADPTAAGAQNANEVTYTGYARVPVARSTSGWTVTGNNCSPVAAITFPTGTGGSGTATFWSTGVAASGATSIINSGTLSPSVVLGSGVTPTLSTATVINAT